MRRTSVNPTVCGEGMKGSINTSVLFGEWRDIKPRKRFSRWHSKIGTLFVSIKRQSSSLLLLKSMIPKYQSRTWLTAQIIGQGHLAHETFPKTCVPCMKWGNSHGRERYSTVCAIWCALKVISQQRIVSTNAFRLWVTPSPQKSMGMFSCQQWLLLPYHSTTSFGGFYNFLLTVSN